MEVQDQRSGGCEVAAGSGSLPQIAVGLARGFGPSLPEEESDVCVLESKRQDIQETHTVLCDSNIRDWKHRCIFFESVLRTLGLSLMGSGGTMEATGQVFTSSP